MKRVRMTVEDRRVAILEAAMRVASSNPTKPLRREDVARECGCCPSLLTHYFTNMTELEKSAVLHAITIKATGALALGMACIAKIHGIEDRELKTAAAEHLAAV